MPFISRFSYQIATLPSCTICGDLPGVKIVRQFLFGCFLGLVLVGGTFAVLGRSEIEIVARQHGWLEKTEAEMLQAFSEQLAKTSSYLGAIDNAFKKDGEGSEIVVGIGVDALRGSLTDPDSAKFSDAYVTYNPKTKRLYVCGLVNGKNVFGGYAGEQPFRVEIDLGSSIETSKGHRPLLYNSVPGDYSDALAKLDGRPGKIFEDSCGLAMSLKLLQMLT